MPSRLEKSISYEEEQIRLTLIHAKIEQKLHECEKIQRRFVDALEDLHMLARNGDGRAAGVIATARQRSAAGGSAIRRSSNWLGLN